MFSEKALFDTQVDVGRAATVNTVSHVMDTYRLGGKYINMQWVYMTVATLVGFVAHGLVVSQLVKPSTGNAKVDAGLTDVVKFGTVLSVSHVLMQLVNGREISFSQEWMKSTGITLAGFFVFHYLIADMIPTVEGHQMTIMNASKAVFTSVVAQLLTGQSLDQNYLMSLGGVVAGFVLFDELVHPNVFA